MADRLKINGNFLVVFEDITFVEYIRNVVAETTFKRLDQDNFSFFYREAKIAQTDDIFILGGDYTTFLYSSLINDVTGVPFTSGNDLDDFLSAKLAASQVNVVVQQLPPAPDLYHAQELDLNAFTPDGVDEFQAVGAGILFTFNANQLNTMRGNLDLNKEGISYLGQSFFIHLHWQFFTAAAAGNNVIFEVDFAFVKDGEDNYSKIDGTIVLDIPLDGRNSREQYTDTFAAISGANDSKTLQLTLRRKGQGAGGDNYNGDADVYSSAITNP